MITDPVLAARSLPAGTDGYRVPLTFRVEGGLNYLRGNTAPYFSLTYTQHRKGFPNQCCAGGAGHDRILELFPQYADLATLHLSSIDGVPMHAEANGWYWLTGAMGNPFGERYHGGNSEGHYGGSYRKPTEAECLDVFARHCRITTDEAATIRERVRWAAEPRATWGRIVDEMRPRWAAEAAATIERHHLRVYGDPWPVPA